MMDEVYIYNRDLELIGAIDTYSSCIWADRYWELGDCELYVPATAENVQALQIGNLLMRPDSIMVCEIRKVELTTSAEDGNYLTATGIDTKAWLDRRVVWETMQTHGKAEVFIRSMVDGALGTTAAAARQMVDSNGDLIFGLGTLQGYDTTITTQVSYQNIGEKVREYCRTYGWGYRVRMDSGILAFELYNGADRADTVIFSEEYDNLAETDYVRDETSMGNVALIAGEGQGSERTKVNVGAAEGLDRFEIYVDAKDISKNIEYSELVKDYPLGVFVPHSTGGYDYVVDDADILIVDDQQLAKLQQEYPNGTLYTDGDQLYYWISGENIALAFSETDEPEDSATVVLYDIVYDIFLYIRGYEKIAEYGAVTSFDGAVNPAISFVYGEDYFLGDIVTVQNEYGITVQARIVEVVEVNDENGYNVEPKFEYISQEG